MESEFETVPKTVPIGRIPYERGAASTLPNRVSLSSGCFGAGQGRTGADNTAQQSIFQLAVLARAS